jgi:hypothetical protein
LTGYKADNWESEYPNIDIRHSRNWSGNGRMSPDEFKNKNNCLNWKQITPDEIPGWNIKDILWA